MRIFSASTTPATAHEVVIGLGKMIFELTSGDAEITAEQRAILDELTAEAQRHLLGC
jgi:hypothetical protein